MLLATPRFWYRRTPTPLARLLQPLSWLYGLGVALHRRSVPGERLPVAVLAVGNITAGGTGKTPLVIALAAELRRRGRRVAVLLRGYGALSAYESKLVVAGDPPSLVGDEALEIRAALPEVPVWVGRDRLASGRAALAAGADLLLLDDGLQHWRLAHDCSISVLDRGHGLGNGLLLPAGPLREPAAQLGRADLLVLTGASGAPLPPAAWPPGKPWFVQAGSIVLPARLRGEPLLAFCGIGLPDKFFGALHQAGLPLVATASFPDHHAYSQAELERLQTRAHADGASLVTTVKDWQRLPQSWRQRVEALPLELDAAAVRAIADGLLPLLPGAALSRSVHVG